MAQCTNCQHKWKGKDIRKSGFSKNGHKCPSCQTTQYISARTRRILTFGWLNLLTFFVFPFVIELSSEDEPLL